MPKVHEHSSEGQCYLCYAYDVLYQYAIGNDRIGVCASCRRVLDANPNIDLFDLFPWLQWLKRSR
jgi:hypothetical protein